MNKIYALALASLLVSPAAVLADNHLTTGNPGYGNQGCEVEHPGGPVQAKNPGKLFQAARSGHDVNPKQAADLVGAETVGAFIDAACGAPD